MAAVAWARTVRCDFPECQSVAEVALGDDLTARNLPDGWVDLQSKHIDLRDWKGNRLTEFCTIHARATLASLAAAIPSLEWKA